MTAQQTLDRAIALLKAGEAAQAIVALADADHAGLGHAASAVDLCVREAKPDHAIAILNDVRPVIEMPAGALAQIALDLMALGKGNDALKRLAEAGLLHAGRNDAGGFDHLYEIAELIVGGGGVHAAEHLRGLGALDAANAARWNRLAGRCLSPPAPAKAAAAVAAQDPELAKAAQRLAKLSPQQACTVVERLSRAQVKEAFAHDAWLRNYFLNMWEYLHKVDVLESYPWNVALPIADLCNARCTFCNSWLHGRNVLQPDQLERYVELLRYTRVLGIQGHGEPLANPHIETILKRVAEVIDPRAQPYLISNAMFLRKRLPVLLDARVMSYQLSLNATTNETHHKVMGLGENAFEEVQAAVKALVEARDTKAPGMFIAISMVLTADNIHEAPAFVRLGNQLGVTRVFLRTLSPVSSLSAGLNYHTLSPCLHPDFARLKDEIQAEIARSRIPVEASPETWGEDALPPALRAQVKAEPPRLYTRREAIGDPDVRQLYQHARDSVVGHGELVEHPVPSERNPYGREAPFDCGFVYQQFISTQLTFRIVPCCYISDVPGHKPVVFDGTEPFMAYWNSPAFVALRRWLRDGPLLDNCKTCPMHGAF